MNTNNNNSYINSIALTQVQINIIPPASQITYPPKYQLLCKKHQLNPNVSHRLFTVLSTSKLVLLCDDSSSMAQPISQEGNDPFAIKKSTRWLQLKKLATQIISYCSATNQQGLDIHFFNRQPLLAVKSHTGLANAFSKPPSGGTPLCTSLKNIFTTYKNLPEGKRLLVIVITDGEPSDGTRNELFSVIENKASNIHVSFAECTDNEEDMQYLDQWDGKIPNFQNTDDYRQESAKVRAQQGENFKFDYSDYVVKIMLATFIRWNVNLDQPQIEQQQIVQEKKNPSNLKNNTADEKSTTTTQNDKNKNNSRCCCQLI